MLTLIKKKSEIMGEKKQKKKTKIYKKKKGVLHPPRRIMLA
jgi:hypothetical protein